MEFSGPSFDLHVTIPNEVWVAIADETNDIHNPSPSFLVTRLLEVFLTLKEADQLKLLYGHFIPGIALADNPVLDAYLVKERWRPNENRRNGVVQSR